ncbi:hypothetical protein GWK08_01005 [Leptobacterium flavescens]|uniref:VanZ-like domain-containing protein n=1 Tax=Leptobacterium flavescens TaxID=472055 RepID=A0A6P0UNU6_9FLAO|nr:hypothetical protein [Leptobacterium flavescens]NER12006.1 hypothetical protein [Leptobacterium flavescens]
MNGLVFKTYIRYVYWGTLVFHSLNKFVIRPWMLENNSPRFLVLFVNSVPNFLEAVIGTTVISGLLLFTRQRFPNSMNKFKENTLFLIAVMLAAVFVITQELKIHNLGGRNVYDPYDLIASLIGLIFIGTVLLRYGLIRARA